MKQFLRIIFVFCIFPLGLNSAFAQTTAVRPVIVYNVGAEKKDNTFNAAAEAGAKRAAGEFNLPLKDYQLPPNESAAAFYRKMIEMEKPTLVIAVGFQNTLPVLQVAEVFPEVKFTVIDGIIPPLYNNVQSIIFKDHEGAFLAGMAAGLKTETNVVGFVGGMDVPLIRNFAYGYLQGVKYANPEAIVLQTMVGSTAEAWNNPEKAAAITEKQINEGADVIFAAAGASGMGVLKKAHDMGKLAIGVDTNQNALFPGSVLTSMVKHVDTATYNALLQAHTNSWEPGIKYLGLAEGALTLAMDQHNEGLMTESMLDRIAAAKELIIRGDLFVDPYAPK